MGFLGAPIYIGEISRMEIFLSSTPSFTIAYDDPENLLVGHELLATTIEAAVTYLDQFLRFSGTLDILVRAEATATGLFAGTGSTVYKKSSEGVAIYESSYIYESRLGVDPLPSKADVTISIDPTSSYFAKMWWDPDIGSSLAANPPDGLTDAFSVVLHEILHGLGVTGWRSRESGLLPGNYASVWDSLVEVVDGHAIWLGETTKALLGEPVEIRLGGSQGGRHLGNGPDVAASNQQWIERSSLNSYYFRFGERYTLGRLELSMLADLGWMLKDTDLVDVVNRWDDKQTPLFMVGYSTDENLLGDVLSDRIEGRGGKDLLIGLSGDDSLLGGDGDDEIRGGDGDDLLEGGDGNDSLLGGEGNDRLDGGAGLDRFSLPSTASSNIVERIADGTIKVSGPEGTDMLVNVERLVFEDKALAFDFNGIGGTAYRLYQAAYDRAPDAGGLGFWMHYLDGGFDLTQAAENFLKAPEFIAIYGADPTPEQYVYLLYKHVHHREPDAGGLQFWIDAMYNKDGAFGKQWTKGEILLKFSESDENIANLVGVMENGFVYAPYEPGS